jgi:hypothetical protein
MAKKRISRGIILLKTRVDIANCLKYLRDEVNSAQSSFYLWKSIDDLKTNRAKLEILQANALSWNIITHSLQTTYFVAIGRIFDQNARSLSAKAFIDLCKANLDQFTIKRFEEQRIEDNSGQRPDYLTPKYLSEVYVPIPADFDKLSSSIETWTVEYNKTLKPIRHKVFAHRDSATLESSEELFSSTNTQQIEAILKNLNALVCVMQELLNNGRLSRLDDHQSNNEASVSDDLKKLVGTLSRADITQISRN